MKPRPVLNSGRRFRQGHDGMILTVAPHDPILAVDVVGDLRPIGSQLVENLGEVGRIGVLQRRSYQYVAMYKVINKGAMMEENPTRTGWNGTFAATGLLDHTSKSIARPNNDTLYITTIMDLRSEPVIVSYPAFDSKFVVLEISAYDHYVDIPLTTTKSDFGKPTKVLYYTKRTQGYDGGPVEGVDRVIEMTGDFAIAFLRVMPHAAEPDRLENNLEAMKQVKAVGLSEYLGQAAKSAAAPAFPDYNTDEGIFENNFLEVMQFVFNHTTFDPDGNPYVNDLFLPKGSMNLEPMVAQSAYGPIGLPAHQAVYPGIIAADGAPLERPQRLRDPDVEGRDAPFHGFLVGDALRCRERILHPQRSQEVQRQRERRHEARRPGRDRGLHRRRKTRGRARGKLASHQSG